MKFITVQECQGQQEAGDARIIDIRESWEHTIYSIGVLHLPMAEFVEQANDLDRNAGIILMCKSGKRAEALANLLETEHGFSNIAVMEGGITAWVEINDPTNELY